MSFLCMFQNSKLCKLDTEDVWSIVFSKIMNGGCKYLLTLLDLGLFYLLNKCSVLWQRIWITFLFATHKSVILPCLQSLKDLEFFQVLCLSWHRQQPWQVWHQMEDFSLIWQLIYQKAKIKITLKKIIMICFSHH